MPALCCSSILGNFKKESQMCQQLESSFKRIHFALFCKILHTFSSGYIPFVQNLIIYTVDLLQKETHGDIIYTFDKNII